MAADPTEERTQRERDRRPTAEQPREERSGVAADDDRVVFSSWDAPLVPHGS